MYIKSANAMVASIVKRIVEAALLRPPRGHADHARTCHDIDSHSMEALSSLIKSLSGAKGLPLGQCLAFLLLLSFVDGR